VRLTLLFVVLALLVLIPFLLWGDHFEAWFTREGAVRVLAGTGSWAWAVGLLLLVADLVLPLPGTAIMAALGYLYGWLWGGLLAGVGSVCSGWLAYGLCRRLGRRVAVPLVGEAELQRSERFFAGSGGEWTVVLSRWLPLMPEVVACSAGLAKMPRRRFGWALACGSMPLGFVYAGIGTLGQIHGWLAIILSVGLPPVLWVLVGRRMGHRTADGAESRRTPHENGA